MLVEGLIRVQKDAAADDADDGAEQPWNPVVAAKYCPSH